MRALSFILALSLCTGIGAQNIKTYQSSWNEKNGDVFKTKFKDFRYTEKGMYYYYISNDRDNIYINLRVFDDNVKQVIKRSGLTVWINTDGKKNKTLGIKYPAFQSINNTKPSDQTLKPLQQINQEETGNTKTEPQPERVPDFAMNSLLLIGFNKSGPELVSTSDKNNFSGSVFNEKEYMYYQLILPISKLPALKKNSVKKNESFILGLSHGKIRSMNMERGGDQRMYGGEGGGMRGGGGGGMRGGGGGGMRGGGGGGMRGGGMRGGGGEMRSGGGGGMRAEPADSKSSVILWLSDIKLASE